MTYVIGIYTAEKRGKTLLIMNAVYLTFLRMTSVSYNNSILKPSFSNQKCLAAELVWTLGHHLSKLCRYLLRSASYEISVSEPSDAEKIFNFSWVLCITIVQSQNTMGRVILDRRATPKINLVKDCIPKFKQLRLANLAERCIKYNLLSNSNPAARPI